MVASDTFAELLREQFAPLSRITMRRMFGKTGVFCEGVMFGIVTENSLYLRVDDENKEAFKEQRAIRRSTTRRAAAPSISPGGSPSGCSRPEEFVAWARAEPQSDFANNPACSKANWFRFIKALTNDPPRPQ
jgi:DNA transformation protein